ncbi:terpenoid cyclases/protein prenyltransferase alpha-alpha toroid, partial [Blyttiomyces helicus]
RMTFGYFCLSGLDLLGSLPQLTQEKRAGWVEWIYAQQIHPNADGSLSPRCGFRGSPFAGTKHCSSGVSRNSFSRSAHPPAEIDTSHITMTHTALLCLVLLGDDLSRVNAKAIVAALRAMQQPDGSFECYWKAGESDMRFVFCACAISYVLNDWSGIDVEKCIEFIRKCQTYEGGFSQKPNQESHGGSTYCAIASLALMGRIDDGIADKDRTLRWLLFRQEDGFQGRPNKPHDTCYAFWIGGAIDMLGMYHLVDTTVLKFFLSQTYSPKFGGYGKLPGDYPDLMHTYLGLSGLAI